MSNFRVGQKVVCIMSRKWKLVRRSPWSADEKHPQYGEVYVISAVIHDQGLWVKVSGFGDQYDARFFRPVAYPKQSLEHDIALFNHVRTSDKERA